MIYDAQIEASMRATASVPNMTPSRFSSVQRRRHNEILSASLRRARRRLSAMAVRAVNADTTLDHWSLIEDAGRGRIH
jgi:hypothetical protein